MIKGGLRPLESKDIMVVAEEDVETNSCFGISARPEKLEPWYRPRATLIQRHFAIVTQPDIKDRGSI